MILFICQCVFENNLTYIPIVQMKKRSRQSDSVLNMLLMKFYTVTVFTS